MKYLEYLNYLYIPICLIILCFLVKLLKQLSVLAKDAQSLSGKAEKLSGGLETSAMKAQRIASTKNISPENIICEALK